MKLILKQGIRHILTGGFADLVDIGIFNLLFLCLAGAFAEAGGFSKAISFLVAAVIKYFGNKYWAFEKPERVKTINEVVQFLAITLIGLVINVASFSGFVKINPGLSIGLWREMSVVLSLLITAIWNFLGYKFIVFKK